MASINQLVSEIAHSVHGADNIPARRAIRLSIIHARNMLIRHSYEQHGFVDRVLRQRFRVSLIDVPDGDINDTVNFNVNKIKRTNAKVPRPTRLDNGIPFNAVHTTGYRTCKEIPYVSEASVRYYKSLPGFCPNLTYDFINDFIYIFVPENSIYEDLQSIIIDSVFEKPEIIKTNETNGLDYLDSKGTELAISDDDEYLLPEDMIEDIKKIVVQNYNVQVPRQTDEVPTQNLTK